MRRALILVALIVAFVVSYSTPAHAVDLPPFSTGEKVVLGLPGFQLLLGSVFAEGRFAELVGRDCTADVDVLNNESVHPNTDIILRSGDREIVIPDIERQPDINIERPGLLLLLASRVDVYVRIGPDRVFSGGLTVQVSCPDEPPTTTTTAAPLTPTPAIAPPVPPPPPARAATPPRAPVTELPRTGTDWWPLTIAGAGLAGLGAFAVRYGRTYRRG